MSFEKIIDKGAYRGRLNQCVLSMATFKGALYVGSGIQGGGVDTQNRVGPAPPEMIRIHRRRQLGSDRRRQPRHAGRSQGMPVGLTCRASTTSSTATSGASASTKAGSTSAPSSGARSSATPTVAAGRRRSRTSSITSTRRPSSTTSPASTSTAATTARTGCRSRPTAWTTRTTWDCAPWSRRRTACSSAPPIRIGPKIMPLGGDRYVPNPRGGCEVHFASRRRA